MNPIVRRELLDMLRTRKAVAVQVVLALASAALVLVRWPTGGVSDLNGWIEAKKIPVQSESN